MLTKARVDSLTRKLDEARGTLSAMRKSERTDVQNLINYVEHSLKLAKTYLTQAAATKRREEQADRTKASKCATCGGKVP
jgi:hypothetical protein